MNEEHPEQPRSLLIGNWKMYGHRKDLREVSAVAGAIATCPPAIDTVICPPFTLIASAVRRAARSSLGIGGQDCHPQPAGAYTGDVSATMLKDLGARLVILGHSERRRGHAETDELVGAKAEAALDARLTPVICVGEADPDLGARAAAQHAAGQFMRSSPRSARAHDVVLAYEPAWAIGTHAEIDIAYLAEFFALLSDEMQRELGSGEARAIALLYGGSVSATNAAELMRITELSGLLVGGASLSARTFLSIRSSMAAAQGESSRPAIRRPCRDV